MENYSLPKKKIVSSFNGMSNNCHEMNLKWRSRNYDLVTAK